MTTLPVSCTPGRRYATPATGAAAPTSGLRAATACTAVLTIDALPRRKRMAVEDAMVRTLESESQLYAPWADPLAGGWFTSWHRSDTHAGCVACRQVLTGFSGELEALADELRDLEVGFRLRRVD